MPRFAFIYNPNSGRLLRRPRLVGQLRALIDAAGLDATVVATQRRGHATDLAREALARGCDRIVAVGGDGTMNEVAQAVVGTPAAFGLIPCGSGDGLGRCLGIHGSLRHAFGVVVGGRPRVIDTGTANGRAFFNVMGVGFDAEIARRFNALPARGLRNYVRTGWNTFFGYRPATYRLRGEDWTEERTAFIVAVANSDQYGNDARIAPGAQVDDGRLDLVAVPPAGPLSAVGHVARMFRGRFDRHPQVLRRPGTRFTIELPGPAVFHVDGETADTGPRLEVAIRPASLRILVPA